MNLGSENADKVNGLLARIKYLEDSDDVLPAELREARYCFLKRLEDMVKEDRYKYEMDLIKSRSMSISATTPSNPEFKIKKYYRPFLIDQGSGGRMVQYTAIRIKRPDVKGYGMTEEDAVRNLICEVQPI